MSSTEKVTDPTTKKSEITSPDASCGDGNALGQGGTSEVGLQSAENITEGIERSDWAGLVREYEENNARCRELEARLDDITALVTEGLRQIVVVLATMPPETIIGDRIVKLSEQIFEECKSVSAFIAEIGLKDAQSLRQMSESFAHQASQSNHAEKKRRYMERSESIARAAVLVEQIAYQTIERLSAYEKDETAVSAKVISAR